jgi:hypothetical protein
MGQCRDTRTVDRTRPVYRAGNERVGGQIMTGVHVERVSYGGWEECLRVTNGEIELVATTAVGPRIVHFGFVDGRNEFQTIDEDLGSVGGEEWRLYGGHRLWHAPEAEPRTYEPDNHPIEYEQTPAGCRLVQPTEETTGVRKELHVEMAAAEPAVTVTHRLTNTGVWPIELAPWAITVCQPGGKAVVPFPDGDPDDLLPDRSLVFWPSTDASDDRIEYVDDHVLVRQTGEELKIGASVADGWTGYVNDGHAFVKTFEYDPDATYPDRGSSVEVFVLDFMLELETLGPLVELGPGDTAEHVEHWTLVDGVETPEDGTDARTLEPR